MSTLSEAVDPALAFDVVTEAGMRAKPCVKWNHFDPDVLPMWVADMDFPVADVIRDAMIDHATRGSLGYPVLPELQGVVAERLRRRFGWTVEAASVQVTPGVIPSLVFGTQTFCGPGEQVIIQTPAYPPFFDAVKQAGTRLLENPLVNDGEGYRLDLDGLRAAITPATRMLLFCNPHNPTGRVFRREELEALAELVLEHRLWVVSDELHADLVLHGRHVPFASLSPEVGQRTITLYGPTKAFNIAGLKVAFLISENPALLARYKEVVGYRLPGVNVLGQVAALAAYQRGDAWLDGVTAYLRGNRDHLLARLRAEAPQVKATTPEGTYLAWLDLRATGLGDDPSERLLQDVRLALNTGKVFGEETGRGFVRLNFATSRQVLDRGIDLLVKGIGGA